MSCVFWREETRPVSISERRRKTGIVLYANGRPYGKCVENACDYSTDWNGVYLHRTVRTGMIMYRILRRYLHQNKLHYFHLDWYLAHWSDRWTSAVLRRIACECIGAFSMGDVSSNRTSLDENTRQGVDLSFQLMANGRDMIAILSG